MKKLENEDIINTYIKIGIEEYEAIKSEDFKRTNKNYPKLVKVYKFLEKNISIAKEIFPRLLKYENINVREIASAHCLALGIYADEAEGILTQIANDHENKVLAFEAEMTLKVWKEGNLTIYRKNK